MPSNRSAAKRHRQNLKNRLRNRSYRSALRTKVKTFTAAAAAKQKEGALKEYRELSGMLDQAVSKGIMHINTAARKKSRMHKVLGRA